MATINDKHVALKKLRRKFTASNLLYSACGQTRPDKSPFNTSLFENGLHEMVCGTPFDHAATMAFAVAAAGIAIKTRKLMLIAALTADVREHGALYGLGLQALRIDSERVCIVTVDREKELLWAAEEAASCDALGAVIAILGAREKLYRFTASRRLKLRQEKSGVPIFIIRNSSRDATAATARWHVAAAPSCAMVSASSPVPLLGPPRLSVWLERYAGLPPQNWEIELDASMGMRMAAPLSDRPAGEAETRYRSVA